MDCKKLEKHFIFYLEHSLDKAVTQQISDHLQHCAHCQEQLKTVQQALEMIPSIKQNNPNPYLFERIEAKLQNAPNVQTQTSPGLVRIFSTLTVSLLLLATAFTGYYYVTNNASATNETPSASSMIAGQYEMTPSQQDIVETYYLTEE